MTQKVKKENKSLLWASLSLVGLVNTEKMAENIFCDNNNKKKNMNMNEKTMKILDL